MVKEQVFFGLNWYLWYNWSISKRQGLKYSLVETEAGLHVLVVKSHWQSPLHQKCPFPWGHNAQVAAAWFPQLTSKYTNREWIISQLSSLDIIVILYFIRYASFSTCWKYYGVIIANTLLMYTIGRIASRVVSTSTVLIAPLISNTITALFLLTCNCRV